MTYQTLFEVIFAELGLLTLLSLKVGIDEWLPLQLQDGYPEYGLYPQADCCLRLGYLQSSPQIGFPFHFLN
jgi:hypothetical protein